jgi:hypothetical protein
MQPKTVGEDVLDEHSRVRVAVTTWTEPVVVTVE